jgi:hypothetical protein
MVIGSAPVFGFLASPGIDPAGFVDRSSSKTLGLLRGVVLFDHRAVERGILRGGSRDCAGPRSAEYARRFAGERVGFDMFFDQGLESVCG